jgi:hypothetical protein
MTLNLTFIVQIFHFGIAYLFLRYLVLQPALSILSERTQEIKKLKAHIKKTHAQISALEEIAHEAEIECHVFTRTHLPYRSIGTPHIFRRKVTDIPWQNFDTVWVSQCAAQTSDYIVSAINGASYD